MPMYNKLILGKQARDLGFVRDAFEKTNRLTEVLIYIGSEPELAPLLALKGGTAINLAVFNLPRLSVDIDLDFAENLTKDKVMVGRERINELLGRHMSSEGYEMKGKTKRTHALDSFVYSYTNAAGNPDNIKVEINYGLRCHVLPTALVTAQTGGVFPAFPVQTISPVEIFASKIVALSSRAAARDLFDINNMIYYGLFDEPDLILLRKCAVFYLAIAGDEAACDFDFEKINNITLHKIRTDLYPMIRNAERFDLQATQERVFSFLKERMTLTNEEVMFLKCFAAGRYEPQLLFEDKDILKRIENHPMAIWRLRHIRHERNER